MANKKVSVVIEGRPYSLITPDDEGYVKEVADEVVAQIRIAAQQKKQLDTRDCAILAALNFCDERNKERKRSQSVIDKADKIISHSGGLGKQCAEYKQKLAEVVTDNTRMSKRIKALEEQLAVLLKENEQLKSEQSKKSAEAEKPQSAAKTTVEKKNEKLMDCVPMKQFSLFGDDEDAED